MVGGLAELGSLRDPDRLKPWLVSVAANEARQACRRQRRRALVEIDVDPPPPEASPATRPTGPPRSTSRLPFATSLPTSVPSSPSATRRVSTRQRSPRLPADRPRPSAGGSPASSRTCGGSSPMPELDRLRRAAHSRGPRLRRSCGDERGRHGGRSPRRSAATPAVSSPGSVSRCRCRPRSLISAALLARAARLVGWGQERRGPAHVARAGPRADSSSSNATPRRRRPERSPSGQRGRHGDRGRLGGDVRDLGEGRGRRPDARSRRQAPSTRCTTRASPEGGPSAARTTPTGSSARSGGHIGWRTPTGPGRAPGPERCGTPATRRR